MRAIKQRQVDGIIAGEDGEDHHETKAVREQGDVVVIGDDSEEDRGGGAKEEWEDVSVEAEGVGGLPVGAHVRKASKQERTLALYIHRAHIVCLLSRGCLLSNLCESTRVRRRWDKIRPAAKLALPPTHLIRRVHIRALVDWMHANFEVVEQSKGQQDKMTEVSLAKALDAGKVRLLSFSLSLFLYVCVCVCLCLCVCVNIHVYIYIFM